MGVLARTRANLRYARGIGGYLRDFMRPTEARALIERQLAARDESFLNVLARGIYGTPASPYRALLLNAGLDHAKVSGLVHSLGLEAALTRLYEAGVYLSLEEFKGRRPLRRNGLELAVKPSDFDNPLLVRHYEGRTSGSRTGAGSRVLIDFDLMHHEAACFSAFLAANRLSDRPVALWRVAPPGSDGLKLAFRFTKLGMTPERWFTPNRLNRNAEGLRAAVFTYYTLIASRILRRPLPWPQPVSRDEVLTIVRWLAQKRAAGTPAFLDANASPVMRICVAAKENGIDISGTVFGLGGEPYTDAKERMIAGVGCTAVSHYDMAELGNLGVSCATPAALDDQHIFTDKVAIIQRERPLGASGATVPAIYLTSLLASSPKLMLNVESGDYANLERRACGCYLGELGLTTHLSQLRSYDKLTSEGVAFVGGELLTILEDVLPARFGGYATDYQLAEEEGEEGVLKVAIVIAPSVGPVDNDAVIATVLQSLARSPYGGRLMADEWSQGRTLKVVRRDPHATMTSKVLPLHVLGVATPTSDVQAVKPP